MHNCLLSPPITQHCCRSCFCAGAAWGGEVDIGIVRELAVCLLFAISIDATAAFTVYCIYVIANDSIDVEL